MTNIENIDKPYPFTEDQEAWLRDLETTEVEEGKHLLHVIYPSGREEFCVFGRACLAMNIPETIDEEDVNDKVGIFDNEHSFLSSRLWQRIWLRDKYGYFKTPALVDNYKCHSIAHMSHEDFSFKQIAAYIRSDPWNVFKDPDEGGQ